METHHLSVSDKNLVTSERTQPGDDAVIGLRRMIEQVRNYGGAHSGDTSRKEVISKMKDAHSIYIARNQEEATKAKQTELRLKLPEV